MSCGNLCIFRSFVKHLQNMMINGSCKIAKCAVICVSSLFAKEMNIIFERPFKVCIVHLLCMSMLKCIIALLPLENYLFI